MSAQLDIGPLQPGDRAPNIVLDAITREGKIAIDDFRGQKPVLVGLYRGLHCPFCRRHIAALAQLDAGPQREGHREPDGGQHPDRAGAALFPLPSDAGPVGGVGPGTRLAPRLRLAQHAVHRERERVAAQGLDERRDVDAGRHAGGIARADEPVRGVRVSQQEGQLRSHRGRPADDGGRPWDSSSASSCSTATASCAGPLPSSPRADATCSGLRTQTS